MSGGLVELFHEQQIAFHEHMAKRNDSLAVGAGTVYGDAVTAIRVLKISADEHRESARYWRCIGDK